MTAPRPFGLLTELTYRCPLACAYCSNPIELSRYDDELSTADWQRVFGEAAAMGVLQCHLSGGSRCCAGTCPSWSAPPPSWACTPTW